MNKRFFVDEKITEEGKYRVLQEDSETKECFGVKDFDTQEEAKNTAVDLQRTSDLTMSERVTGELPEIPVSVSNNEDKFKDTLQDLKNETSQE